MVQSRKMGLGDFAWQCLLSSVNITLSHESDLCMTVSLFACWNINGNQYSQKLQSRISQYVG